MDIKWLGHASVLITSDSGKRIITESNNQIKTQTLFMTKGKVYYLRNYETDINIYREQIEENKPMNKAVAIFLGSLLKKKFGRIRLSGYYSGSLPYHEDLYHYSRVQ